MGNYRVAQSSPVGDYRRARPPRIGAVSDSVLKAHFRWRVRERGALELVRSFNQMTEEERVNC